MLAQAVLLGSKSYFRGSMRCLLSILFATACATVNIDTGVLVQKLSDLPKISGRLEEFGLYRQADCSPNHAHVVVFLNGRVHDNLGLHFLQVHGYVELVFKAKERACFRSRHTVEPGSLLTILVSEEHSVHIRAADVWWAKQYFASSSPNPHCTSEDTQCFKDWGRSWQQLKNGVKLSRVPTVVDGLLRRGGAQAVLDWDPGHVERHLLLMSGVSSVLANASFVANLLDDIAGMSIKHFRKWLDALIRQPFCDMLTLILAESTRWTIKLNVFQTFVPRCNGFKVHTHNVFFSTQLLQGGLTENLFVPVGNMYKGWPRNNSKESDDLSAWVHAAHIERHELAYQTHGCDVAPGPLQVGDGPRLHGLMEIGKDRPDPLRMTVEHVGCEQRLPGERIVFPLDWVHRPRLTKGKKIAMTLVFTDKKLGNAYVRATRDEIPEELRYFPGDPEYPASLSTPKKLRSLLKKLAARLRQPAQAPVPKVELAMTDAGIPEYIDPVLGSTDDDTWHYGTDEEDVKYQDDAGIDDNIEARDTAEL